MRVRTSSVWLAWMLAGLVALSGLSMAACAESPRSRALCGITVNNLTETNADEIVEAVEAMPVRPTIRVVMDPERAASDYRKPLEKLHACADILLCPCDSSYFSRFPTTDSYRGRFEECARLLWDSVDLWEIGNEINGEGWLGSDAQQVADRVCAAFEYIHSRGGETELTPYAFAPGAQSVSMEEWLETYLPMEVRVKIDAVMVSYYDADHDGQHEDWADMFEALYQLFPNAKLGFGECGFPQPHEEGAAFNAQVDAYYLLPAFNDRYVGGYFWWYWQEDCLPWKGNTRFERINAGCLWMVEHY